MPRDLERNSRRAKIWMAVFIIGIMLLSSAAFIVDIYAGNGTRTVKINGYKFELNQNNIWEVNYNGRIIQTYYDPRDLQNINIDTLNFNSNKIYLAYDPSLTYGEVMNNINRVRYSLSLIGIISNPSCINSENCPDLPVTSCETDNNIIYFNLNETASLNIYKKENCQIIEANSEDMNKITDKIILRVFGIL